MENQTPRSHIPAFENNVLKAYKCSTCNRIFSTQVHANVVSGRIPLLMPCSHTICEECLLKMAKTKNISCKICQFDMMFEKVGTLSDIFPVDRFMFGSLINLTTEVAKRASPASEKRARTVPFAPAGMALNNVNSKNVTRKHLDRGDAAEKDEQLCSQQGCTKRAEFRCINCSELYCSNCDKRVHESIRILRNHVRYPIDIANLADFNVSCVGHSSNDAEYCCMTCGTMLCSKCVIKDHVVHDVISIEDKNELELDSFKETLKKATHVLKCMEFTQKKVKVEINANRQNVKPSSLEFEIIKHFATLHSRLQLLEQTMLDQVSKAQVAKVDSLHRLSTELASNISIMHSLVATGNMVAEGGKKHLDKLLLSELEKNIADNLILPCELVEENHKKEDTIQFFTDKSFVDALQNHCRVDFEEGLSFKLAPMTDFSERSYELPSDDVSNPSSDTESIRSRNESESSGTSTISYVKPGCKTRLCLSGSVPTLYTTDTNRNYKRNENPKSSNAPVVLTKDTIETVTVTHLTNPSLFYVQLTRKRKYIEELTQKYELYAEHATTPKEIDKGSTYIVQFTSEKVTKWYRAVVKDIHYAGVTTLYEVFYIDYGNSAVVPLAKIRVMKPLFMQDPPFAHRCRLNGIISQRNEWNDDVLSYMVQFITASKDAPLDPLELDNFLINENRNTNLKMHIIESNKGVLDVDLYSSSQSLIEALIFVGFAQPITQNTDMSKKRKMVNSVSTETKIAPAIVNYQKDQIYRVHVSHVVNPHQMYVQLWDNMQIISNLETAMSRCYVRKEERKMIFTPEKGMVCAAKLRASNKNWWRVEIINLPGGANVEVYALDYGVTEIIPWSQLCKLKDMHKQIDSQAIQVSLTDIAPPKNAGNDWPEETNEFLREYLKDKNLSMYVNEPSKEKLMVTIYENTDEADVCIDALLVRKELAESTGESSLLVEFHKILPSDSNDNVKLTVTRRNIGHLIEEKPRKAAEQSISIMCGQNFLKEIKVKEIKSPSNFYVEVPSWHDDKMQMFKQMANYYSEQVSPAKKWELNSKCVVRSIKDDKYYRAIITKVLEDDTYEVFLKDFIRTETAPTRNLYELIETFSTHDYTFQCCLGGIKPTGGSENWTIRAVEVFQTFIEKYNRIFITKYGPIIDKVLSVQLITSLEEHVGPLERIKTKRIILNDFLIDMGLAMPVKVETDEPVIKGLSEPPTLLKSDICKNPAVSSLHRVFHIEEPENSFASISKFLEDESSVTTESMPASQTKETNWLPAIKFTEKQFKGWTSYVDFEGYVYIQTVKSRRMLKNVTRILENHFKDSQPDPPHSWDIGQMCSLLYHLDNTYCRATVIDLTGEKIIVRLIDYGNQEEVSHEELRGDVLATDVPALAVKCKLENVFPKDGKWPIPLLDRLHFTLVDQECDVIVSEIEEETPVITIYMANECINNLCNTAEWSIRDEKYARKPTESDDDQSVVIEEEEPETSNEDIDVDIAESSVEDIAQTHEKLFNSDLNYNYAQLPKDKTSFKAVVINIIDYRTVVIEPDFVADIMTATKEQFQAISDEIYELGPVQPKLIFPTIGMPCIALFGEDDKWYRAKILDVMDIHANEIKVFFIDYGNVEIVPKDDVRAIKPEWLDYTVTMLTFKIWGITKLPEYDTIDVNLAMKEAVLNKKVICQIQEYNPEVEVKLIDEESYELVYKQLLDDNIIQNID